MKLKMQDIMFFSLWNKNIFLTLHTRFKGVYTARSQTLCRETNERYEITLKICIDRSVF